LSHQMDTDSIIAVTEEDLKEMGVMKIGHRKKILKSIEDLFGVANQQPDVRLMPVTVTPISSQYHLLQTFSFAHPHTNTHTHTPSLSLCLYLSLCLSLSR
jgi:hypothetical protein